jgi:hypothetical protein
MGLPALVDDYLFIGPLIVARLAAEVADIPVDLVERPEQVLEADKRQRVIMVMWAGDRFVEGESGRAAGGASQALRQRWLVIFATNNVGKAAAARTQGAGPVLSSVHRALAGWTPEGAARPMQRANAPLQPTFTQAKAVYPLGFEIALTL